MALVINHNAILPGSNVAIIYGHAAELIYAGQLVEMSSIDLKIYKRRHNTNAVLHYGVALNNAAAGQPIAYTIRGSVIYGDILTPGGDYYLGASAGEIEEDGAGLGYQALVGVAISSEELVIFNYPSTYMADADGESATLVADFVNEYYYADL